MDQNGQQIGIMPRDEAIQEAKGRGLDLVEVAPQAEPVVCKILDYGKYKYQQEKRERKQRQKGQQLKEMRFTSQIEEHDFETKVRHIRRFLGDDDKVRVTVIFRGREIVHIDRGRELLNRLIEETRGVGKVDQGPTQRGKSLQMMLVPSGGDAKSNKGSSDDEQEE